MTPRRTRPRREPGVPLFHRLVLWSAGRCRRPIEKAGVQFAAFRALYELQLVLEQRRASRHGREGARVAVTVGGALGTLAYVMYGVLSGISLLRIDDPVTGVGVALGLPMVMLLLVLLLEHVPAMIDATDLAITGVTPVSDRTAYVARVAYVVGSVGRLVSLLTVPALLMGCFRYPPLVFVPVFAVSILAMTVFCIGIAFAGVLVVLRLWDARRLQTVLLAVQSVSVLALVFAFQLPQHLRDTDVLSISPWIAFAWPPCHQGGLLAVATGQAGGLHVGLAASALGLPLLVLGVTVLLASRGYLAGISTAAAAARGGQHRRRRRRSLVDRLRRGSVERAGFDFWRAQAHRNDQFRSRTYPSIVAALVLGLYFALSGDTGDDPGMLAGTVHLLGLYLPMSMIMSRYGEHWEGRWLFAAAPAVDPARFLRGVVLAQILCLAMPAAALLGAVSLAIGGWAIGWDLAFAAAALLCNLLLAFLFFGRCIPFSAPMPRDGNTGSVGQTFGMMFCIAAWIGVHVAVRVSATGRWVASAAAVAVLLTLWRAVGRVRMRWPQWAD